MTAVYTPKAALPSPDLTTIPNIPADLATLTAALDGVVVATFASSAARDSAIASPVAGDKCYRSDTQGVQVYNGTLGVWGYVGNVAVAKTTLGSNTATVTFSSIPQDFNHLVVVGMVRSTKSSLLDTMNVQCNGDTGVHYEYATHTISNAGTASTATASSGASTGIVSAAIAANTSAASVFSRIIIELPFYNDNSNNTKTLLARNTAPTNPVSSAGVNWIPVAAAAITQISFTVGSGSFLAGSVFELYGVS